MKLTDKELEIMALLWQSKSPMTAAEIIEASSDRTWKESSIYIIMNTLKNKGAVVLACHKHTGTNTARAYEPAITADEYTIESIDSMSNKGIDINIDAIIESLRARKRKDS